MDGTRPHPKSRTTLKPGDRLIKRYSGGGGYGDPAKRDKGAVAQDLREGLISPATASEYAQGVPRSGWGSMLAARSPILS
jgi:N-methylhydantoinase B/oxoprolinase/acetone carboxylase alpha subunit